MEEPSWQQKLAHLSSPQLRKCWHPDGCEEAPIAAHSISRAKVLQLIAEKSHVDHFELKLLNSVPKIDIKSISAAKASVFHGFCSFHDSSIFQEIDKMTIDVYDKKQLFYLAYRAATYQRHILTGKTKSLFESRFSMNISIELKILNEIKQAASVDSYIERYFDPFLTNPESSTLIHTAFLIQHQTATVAASDFFPIDYRQRDTICLSLSVIPISDNESAVVTSYQKSHSSYARQFLASIKTETSPTAKKLKLSALLIEKTENIYFRPSFVNSWSPKKISKIRERFNNTVFNKRSEPLDPELMLFN